MSEAILRLHSGKCVNILDLQPDDIDIKDIAHALALINRFNGHTIWPVSVAIHSVNVARLCPPNWALQGLLHDASEAYLGDIPRPMKRLPSLFGSYCELEWEVQSRIYHRFGCPDIMQPEVKLADQEALEVEGRYAVRGWVKELDVDVVELQRKVGLRQIGWKEAEEEFLLSFRRLGR